MYSTQAWTLPVGDKNDSRPGRLELKEITFDALEPGEVLVEPLVASWEGNSFHAVQRQPIDVCRERGESTVVLGNAGVARVLKLGPGVTELKEGQVCLLQGNYRPDRFGYVMQGGAFGYDCPGTIGMLAKRTKIRAPCLIPLPEGTRHSIAQWAAFSIRYVTAFANWRVAYGTWRLQVSEEDQAVPHVWGWGGGTTFAELTLARLHGADATIITSHDGRVAMAKAHGLRAIDRRAFPNIEYVADRIKSDQDYARRQRQSEEAFLATVRELTDGLGVSIFVDYLGGSLFRSTLKALARQGVLATAGWREGMRMTHIRAIDCIERHQFVNTHYARRSEVVAAMEVGERCGWMPPLAADERPCPYDRVSELVDAFSRGEHASYFPLIQVNT